MILQPNDYNPLPAIIELIPKEPTEVRRCLFDAIRKELFKGGVVCESDEEVEIALETLAELDLVIISKTKYNSFIIKRGPNGQITQ